MAVRQADADDADRATMAKPPADTPSLADLRTGDRPHRRGACTALLMERGEIIDRLIAVKQTQEIRLGVPARRARPT